MLERERRAELAPAIARELNAVEGVDVVDVARRRRGDRAERARRARFTAGGELTDDRGGTWSVEGDLDGARADASRTAA